MSDDEFDPARCEHATDEPQFGGLLDPVTHEEAAEKVLDFWEWLAEQQLPTHGRERDLAHAAWVAGAAYTETHGACVDALRARVAELEAVIEKVWEAWDSVPGWSEFGGAVCRILSAVPSGVLAERDADKWDEGYGDDTEANRPRKNPYRGGNHHE